MKTAQAALRTNSFFTRLKIVSVSLMTVLSACNRASNNKSVQRVETYIKDFFFLRSVGRELNSKGNIFGCLSGTLLKILGFKHS